MKTFELVDPGWPAGGLEEGQQTGDTHLELRGLTASTFDLIGFNYLKLVTGSGSLRLLCYVLEVRPNIRGVQVRQER